MLDRGKVRLVVALMSAALASCASGPSEPVSLGQPSREALRDGGVDVALANRGDQRVDHLVIFGRERQFLGFKTGEQWARTFVGASDPATATLRIDDSRLENTFTAAGFSAEITYAVNATLFISDSEIPLHAEASESYVYDQTAALRAAVSGAITSMAGQASAVLQKHPPAAAARTADAVAAKLRVLTKLFKDGVVSQQEYETKKRQLLEAL
jgi:hypothetical protein